VSYQIFLSRTADKQLAKLRRQQPKNAFAIDTALGKLVDDPHPDGVKNLKGKKYSDIWRVRVGDFRICYTIEDNKLIIAVIAIADRKEIYKLLGK